MPAHKVRAKMTPKQMAKMYLSGGHSVIDIGRAAGVGTTTAWRLLEQVGAIAKRKVKTQKRDARVVAKFRKGVPMIKIATQEGMSIENTRRLVRKHERAEIARKKSKKKA